MARSNLAKGYPIALLAAAVLSTTGVLIRYLTQNYAMPALVLAFWRDVFVGLTMLPILAIVSRGKLKVKSNDLRYLVLYGVVLALFNSLWTLSVALNGAAVATVLAYSSAAFTALLGWWLLKEKLTWAKIIAVILSLAGCVFVAGAYDPVVWQANPGGIAAGLLSGIGYASYSLLGRTASQRGLNPWTTLLYTFSTAAVVLLLMNLLPLGFLPGAAKQPADLFWLGKSVIGWVILILLAAGPTVAGFGLYNVSLTYLPSSIANLLVTTEPVFTTVFAYFLLGEQLTIIQIGGAGLIMAGVVFLRIFEDRQEKRQNMPSVSSAVAD